ncbi:hypothetical protein UPYG_G00241060 [Umbra pygmaea]|uniref:G-protein coupled receptors family 1 profile domain-containing protein n=1 Tax=Umbra pygmaea TaxID=75934 RepID=A0ABD0WFC1_UMBPY
MSEKKNGPAESTMTENGLSKVTPCKMNGDKENGHCQCPPTPSMRTTPVQDEADMEESSSSEGKGKPKLPDLKYKRAKRASRKDSTISKHSSRISRASNKSMDLFASRRKRRRSSASRKKVSQAREKRFTFVLAVVMGVFVVCWFPFFFSYSLHGVCGDACKIPDTLFKFFFWIGYCNSSLNPAIYTIFNQDFRRAFQKILCKSWKKSF